jgi:hypothetical protein
MPIVRIHWLQNVLSLAAVGLSLFQALITVVSIGFGQTSTWPDVLFSIFTGTLWLPALATRRFPGLSLLTIVAFLGVAFVLYPIHYPPPNSLWTVYLEGIWFVRFGLAAGILMALNFVLIKRGNRSR